MHPLGEVFEQVEQQRLGRLDVIDHHHHRPVRRGDCPNRRTAQNVSSPHRVGATPTSPPRISTRRSIGFVVGEEITRASRTLAASACSLNNGGVSG